jgi:DNA-binding NtrC family response regulator
VADVNAGRFGQDLYYRLRVIEIRVPPLARSGRKATGFTPRAANQLVRYGWPGNVRELEHAVERAVILANGPSIRVRELPPEVTQKTRRRAGDDSLDLQEQERVMIERALDRFGGNRRRAAEALKISTVTLWRKMKHYGLSS